MKRLLSSEIAWIGGWAAALLFTGASSVHWAILASTVIVLSYIYSIAQEQQRRDFETRNTMLEIERRLQSSIADVTENSR